MRGSAGAAARGRSPVLGAALLAALLPVPGCRSAVGAGPVPPAQEASRAWVERTLAALTLEEKAAQLVFVRADGRFRSTASEEHRELLREVAELGVGGVVLFRSEMETAPRLLNDLQRAAPVPLLVAADLERGLAFRIPEGSVPLPWAMAIGATGSTGAAEAAGEVAGREARALGIHWLLAPVADVNSNPANPVINLRSFGEDPEQAAAMVAAFVRGARRAGALTTAKHFPGHGDTATDSHRDLPALAGDRERLAAVELVPFRGAIEAGVDSVMLGHIAVPSVDPTGAPATLSRPLVEEVLRGQLGFSGIVVTDALEMRAMRPYWTGAAAVGAVAAGADVLLLPGDPRVAVQALVREVVEGRLGEARLDTSVRRILAAKARLGLDRERLVDRDAVPQAVSRPEDMERAENIARQSITAVRNRGDVLPLRAEEPLDLLHLVLTSRVGQDVPLGAMGDELAARGVTAETRVLGPEVSAETLDELASRAGEASHVLVSAFVTVRTDEQESDLSPSQARLLERLHGSGTPVILASFGSPYLLAEVPDLPVYLCAYGWAGSSIRALAAGLFGEIEVGGRLPVTLPGLYPAGHGLHLPPRPMTLERAEPEAAGFAPGGLEEVDRIVAAAIEDGAFPGAVVAVGRRGRLVHLWAHGRLSYEPDAPPVTADTLYDLASLTKVIATTTMAMILVDEERLDLDRPLQEFLPAFQGPGKEAVTVRHLLTHSSGVDWWAPLYQELSGEEAYLERIQAMDLVYAPGARSLYSDLGLILLGEVLERVAGEGLEPFVRRRVFAPLGMGDTLFRPGEELLARIAPTEHDPWRGRVLRGEVHDENAFALGGVAPHAGLFGTAGDLARFAQMILNGGVLEHHRIASRETVEAFTRRAGVPDSTRALGWDTKSPEGSSAGSLFSPRSFGHTGFTGTSLWIDPERELFVILLSNRVHPTRDNQLIREVRPAVADAVVRALSEPVLVGLDRVAAGEAGALAGRRVGLIAHAASVTRDGRHAIDVLRDGGIDLVRLFAPEHGLRSRAAAGEWVEDGVEPASGLPVVSLYGEHRRPTAEDLAGLDALVYDLQDAGVRFYTYSSTLLLALEAAAENDVELVVLDRPNPLGGDRVEGPTSAPREVVAPSFVNLAPGPLVHGLTMGELARHANAALARPARLTVVPMTGWRREMTWADTGRPWVPPSPNLVSPEAALAYPGVALLEATNVSEGRGTETPFLLLGAPWLDPAAVRPEAPGFAAEAAAFTPRSSPAAPEPKHRDTPCRGLRLRVTDPAAAQPYRLGIELLVALARHPAFAWRDGGAALTRLLGTPRVLADLGAGRTVDDIVAADAADHAAWRRARAAALLY